MPVPAALTEYLGDVSWTPAEVEDAYTAETAAQAAVVRASALGLDDVRQALYRRVAHNLALRPLPLGVQANITDSAVATNRVGGLDAEVARLEGPHRKVILG